MKRLLQIGGVASLLVVVLATSAATQVTWEAGVKGGVSLAKVTGDTKVQETIGMETLTADFDGFRTGFAGGAFLTAKLQETTRIRLEVLYAQKGGKGDATVTSGGFPAGTGTLTYKFDYVEIPLLLVGSFPAGQNAMIDLFGGPAIAFKTAIKLKAKGGGGEDEEDLSDVASSTDFGLTLGGGVTVLASEKIHVILEGRWTFGLISVPDPGPPDLKNSGNHHLSNQQSEKAFFTVEVPLT